MLELSIEVYGEFYKRSQEKNTSPVAGVFLDVQPTPWSRIVLAFRSADSGR
jgi:hypothetical protein